jgi:hypothetical protein
MESEEKERNIDNVGYRYKDENNDKKFRTKGTIINDTKAINIHVDSFCLWI